MGAGNPVRIPGVEVISLPWSLQREPEEFRTCDIGVYPLWDDEWAKGKCGFKAIQFMACGVPVVAAAVGVNAEIIEDGTTGFLARSEDEWVEKLLLLIRDAPLRQKLGLAGRQVVEERFSLRANGGKFLAAIEAAIDK